MSTSRASRCIGRACRTTCRGPVEPRRLDNGAARGQGGAPMSDIAVLLSDLRIALRRAVPGFEHQPLSRRLDAAIAELEAPPPPTAPAPESLDPHAPGK